MGNGYNFIRDRTCFYGYGNTQPVTYHQEQNTMI